MGGNATRVGNMHNTYELLFWEPEGQLPLGSSKRRWEDNIKMGLKKYGEKENLIHLAQVACFCKYGNEISDFTKKGNLFAIWQTISF